MYIKRELALEIKGGLDDKYIVYKLYKNIYTNNSTYSLYGVDENGLEWYFGERNHNDVASDLLGQIKF